MTFAEKIKELRKQKNLSQTELGKAVGVSLRTVRGWEAEGRYPKQHDIYGKLAEVLGCDVSYLMSDTEAFITDASEPKRLRSLQTTQFTFPARIKSIISLKPGLSKLTPL